MKFTVRSVVCGAHERIRTYGWVQDRWGNEQVGYCLVGAVRATTRNPFLRARVIRRISAQLYKRQEIDAYEAVNDPTHGSIRWNDRWNVNQTQVLDVLQAAAGGTCKEDEMNEESAA